LLRYTVSSIFRALHKKIVALLNNLNKQAGELQERNKMDLNKIWEKKRGDTRAASTIAAGQAHAADRDTMVMRQDGGAGGKGKGTGGSAEKEEETAQCRDDGKSGGGLRELERRKRSKRILSKWLVIQFK
jgi:hypothetical protein